MKKRLLKFVSEDSERDFWALHDSTGYLDWRKGKRLTLPNLKPSLKTNKKTGAGHARPPR